jgi:hypothetical protein
MTPQLTDRVYGSWKNNAWVTFVRKARREQQEGTDNLPKLGRHSLRLAGVHDHVCESDDCDIVGADQTIPGVIAYGHIDLTKELSSTAASAWLQLKVSLK